MKKINVGLLFGGRSGEHEVSINSASAIAQAFNKNKYNIIPIAIAKDGKWYAPIEINDIKTFSPENYMNNMVALLPQPNNGALINLNDFSTLVELDVIFPIIHGTYGEDGTVQGLFELADIPYAGAGVLGSAVGMDKVIMKNILAQHNLPQVKYMQIYRFEIENELEKVKENISTNLKYPLFIKPANLGSSVGITKVNEINELEAALKKAAKYDRKVIIEEGKEVREIEVSVLGNEEPAASFPGEIIPCNEFYDYKAKYVDNKSLLEIPTKLDKSTIKHIQELAVKTYLALDCAGLARIDFFVCKNTGDIYINEINTLPGFTAISMYPKLWEYSGLSMEELLDELIKYALNRYSEKSKNVTNFAVED